MDTSTNQKNWCEQQAKKNVIHWLFFFFNHLGGAVIEWKEMCPFLVDARLFSNLWLLSSCPSLMSCTYSNGWKYGLQADQSSAYTLWQWTHAVVSLAVALFYWIITPGLWLGRQTPSLGWASGPYKEAIVLKQWLQVQLLACDPLLFFEYPCLILPSASFLPCRAQHLLLCTVVFSKSNWTHLTTKLMCIWLSACSQRTQQCFSAELILGLFPLTVPALSKATPFRAVFERYCQAHTTILIMVRR